MSSAALRLWEYRDTEPAAKPVDPAGPPAPAPLATPVPTFTEAQVAERIQLAVQEAEQRWATEAKEQEERRRAQLQATLQAFAAERGRYFREAEAEVVHLALAVARKILGREATLDPDLVGALVRIALDRMGAGPDVKLRVPPGELSLWQSNPAFAGSCFRCELHADPSLLPGECSVETDLGTASFGLEAQFKDIEQGMLDLLRLRPSRETSSDTASLPASGTANGTSR